MPKMSLKSEEMVEALRHVDFKPIEESDESSSLNQAAEALGVDPPIVIPTPMNVHIHICVCHVRLCMHITYDHFTLIKG